MTLKQLFNFFSDRQITSIATDSRELDEHTLWLATQGIHHHALDFYQPAQPCAGIIYEPPYNNPPAGAIAYPNLGAEIGSIAAQFYDHPSRALSVIGVTGTDGKSSLVHFLAQALDAAMIGTIGYGKLDALEPASHTTPDPLRLQQYLAKFRADEVKTVAMEVSSHALAQGRVNGVAFSVGVFTNLSRDHLDYHADMEDYFRAKAKLFAQPLKSAIINIDDPHGRRLIDENFIHKDSQIITVSSRDNVYPHADIAVRATDIHLDHDGIRFVLWINQQRYAVQSPLLARFNVDNLLNVAACLLSQGVAPEEIARPLPDLGNNSNKNNQNNKNDTSAPSAGEDSVCTSAPSGGILAQLHGVIGRAERIALKNGGAAIVDYSHTPAALENILQGVRDHVTGKLWCVFGCGGDRDRGKRPLMAQAAARYADEIIITDDNPRTENPAEIVAEVAAGLDDNERARAHIVQPREQAIIYALARLSAGDAVVIAGKGHEDYQIIGTTKHHFSDQEVVRNWNRN